jgi:hypothetical protein
MHVVRSHALTVEKPLAEAFTFFTPEGERSWAQGWDPRYHHPEDGRLERGLVFTTGGGAEHTDWTVVRLDPPNLVEYVRTTAGSRTGSVLVQCAALGNERTRATVVYSLTSLTSDGEKMLAALDDAAFERFIASWEESIAKAVAAASG